MGKASRRVRGAVTKQPPAALTKKQIARGRKEARQLRIIYGSVAALGVIVLGILAWAIIKEAVIDRHKPVAVVNGNRIPISDYQPLVTYQRFRLHDNINTINDQLAQMDTTSPDNQFIVQIYQQQVQQLQTSLATVQDTALDQLIEDELIREKASEVGLAVTADEVSTYLNEQLSTSVNTGSPVTTTEGITVTPTAVPQAALDEYYNSLLQAMRLSDAEFRGMIKRSLLRTDLQDYLASQVPTTGQVIRLQLIQIDVTPTVTATLETVTTTLQRVEGGDDFATVAKQVSTLTSVQTDGGDVGWQAAGMLESRYGTAVEDLAFSLAPGQAGQVQSNGRYYVMRVAEVDENGPLPEEALTSRRDSALTDWLEAVMATADIQRQLTMDQVPPDPFAS